MGVLLVYDITDSSTFSSLREWLRRIREFCDANVKIALVANKHDLVDRIDYSSIRKAIYENDEEHQESNRTSRVTRKDDSGWRLALPTKTSNKDKR